MCWYCAAADLHSDARQRHKAAVYPSRREKQHTDELFDHHYEEVIVWRRVPSGRPIVLWISPKLIATLSSWDNIFPIRSSISEWLCVWCVCDLVCSSIDLQGPEVAGNVERTAE